MLSEVLNVLNNIMEKITDFDLAIGIVNGAILDVETGMRIHGEREGDMDCIRVLGSVRRELVQLKADLYDRV